MLPPATLKQVTLTNYQGMLGGYRVTVFKSNSSWFGMVSNPPPKAYTIVQLEGPSFKEAVAKARRWIEYNPKQQPKRRSA
jgi:hypothetical protein